MKAVVTTLLSGLAISLIGAAVCLIFDYGDWEKLRAYAAIGLMLGFLAAPEFEPKTFRFPVLWQTFCGCMCGVLLALTLEVEPDNIIRAGVAGLVLGMTSKIWLKHIPFP